MGRLLSTENTTGFHRFVIDDDGGGGVYAFAFERADSGFPEWDYLLSDVEEAKAFCLETWGVPLNSWSHSVGTPGVSSDQEGYA